MNPRTLLLVIAAFGTAGLTAFLVQGWLDRQRAEIMASGSQTGVTATQVLVAKRDLPAGTFVKPEHLRWQSWPESGLDRAFARAGKREKRDFVGSVVRKGLIAGEPLTDRRVVKPGTRGFLSAVLSPGSRAVSVPVDASSGIAGLVFPGDRVDLILSHKFHSALDTGPLQRARRASETLLTNLRVLAIDQSTDDQKGKPILGKTATLEVTPKQAEIVTLALALGKLSMSLRSLAGGGDPVAGGEFAAAPARAGSYTRDSDLSRLLGIAPGKSTGVRILRGGTRQIRAIQGSLQ
jgi:pilus assembly protein CpaB